VQRDRQQKARSDEIGRQLEETTLLREVGSSLFSFCCAFASALMGEGLRSFALFSGFEAPSPPHFTLLSWHFRCLQCTVSTLVYVLFFSGTGLKYPSATITAAAATATVSVVVFGIPLSSRRRGRQGGISSLLPSFRAEAPGVARMGIRLGMRALTRSIQPPLPLSFFSSIPLRSPLPQYTTTRC
jgi:hypothetical protein